MFEHLDDPHPPPSPDRLRAAVHRTVRHRRRRRASVVGGVAVVAGLGGAAVVARDRLTPDQVEVAGLGGAPSSTTAVDGAEPRPDGPLTYLVVGTDDRPGVEGARADTIALVRVDVEAGEVRLLVVPRDLRVAWDGSDERMADVFRHAGPSGLVSVARDELGIEPDHYVEVDFVGAVDLMDALGGIRVAVDQPVRDDPTGLALAPGCQTLDGEAALALGRARHVEVLGGAPGRFEGDLARQARAFVVAAALLQAAGRVAPSDLPALVDTGLSSIAVDDSLEGRDLVALARRVGDLRLVTLGLPLDQAPDDATVLLGPGAGDVTRALVEGGAEATPVSLDGEAVVDASGLRPC